MQTDGKNSIDGDGSQKKRTRASPDQLAVLEDTFIQNTSPNAKLRELLAEKLGMNERSIQIWFQNRRAKVKLLVKRAGGLPIDNKRYFNPYNRASNDLSTRQSIDFTSPLSLSDNIIKAPNSIANGQLIFSSDTLSVGTWRRVALSNDDLICTVCLSESIIRWQITEAGSRFKLEAPISSLVAINLDHYEVGASMLRFEFIQPPLFYMEVNNNGLLSWTQCRDFTESHQASSVLIHQVTGPLNCLESEIFSLTNADPYLKHIIHINTNTQQTNMIQQQPSQNIISPSLKRGSFSVIGLNDAGPGGMMQRRGSAPASTFDTSSFMMRRGSLLDHGSPLIDSLESPMASPMAAPLTLSPQTQNLLFSPQLNDAFGTLNVHNTSPFMGDMCSTFMGGGGGLMGNESPFMANLDSPFMITNNGGDNSPFLNNGGDLSLSGSVMLAGGMPGGLHQNFNMQQQQLQHQQQLQLHHLNPQQQQQQQQQDFLNDMAQFLDVGGQQMMPSEHQQHHHQNSLLVMGLQGGVNADGTQIGHDGVISC